MDIEWDLQRIALQEERLRFERFDAGVAWELGLALKKAADERKVGVAFDISTPSYTLFSHAMAPTPPDNAEWVRRKRNITFRFHRSSYAIGLELEKVCGVELLSVFQRTVGDAHGRERQRSRDIRDRILDRLSPNHGR